MAITFTYDLQGTHTNDRNRIHVAFQRLGWEPIGKSCYRYPTLTANYSVEDWLNHVVPALMLFRSVVVKQGLMVTQFSLDAHSSTGSRNGPPVTGSQIAPSADVTMCPVTATTANLLSEATLRTWIAACETAAPPT